MWGNQPLNRGTTIVGQADLLVGVVGRAGAGLGKAAGVFRRCLPIWLFLACHIILFAGVGFIRPIAILQTGLLVLWIVLFLNGTGLYFSSRFKKTTTAVVMNMGLAIFLWAIMPLLLALMIPAGLVFDYRDKDSLLEHYVTGNPIVQVVVIMDGGAGANNAGKSWDKLSYDWPGGNSSLAVTNRILFKSAGVYCCAGLLFAWFAKNRFRRVVF